MLGFIVKVVRFFCVCVCGFYLVGFFSYLYLQNIQGGQLWECSENLDVLVLQADLGASCHFIY